MSDLIERQAAIDALMDEFKRSPTNAIRAKARIENLPSAQSEIIQCKDCKPERKKGRWLTSDDMYETGVCSVCKYDSQEPISYAITMFKYCPNCGVRMRGEADG